MSIISCLQSYLSEYPGMDLQTITTDLTGKTAGCSLAPAGNGKTETDILGNRTYRNLYVFYAKEAVLDEADRRESYDFLEGFTDWLEERADADDYPVIPGCTVDGIEVSNLLLYDVDDNGTGTYQVQIQLTITKRSKRVWEKSSAV